jgi:hypothetical protein
VPVGLCAQAVWLSALLPTPIAASERPCTGSDRATPMDAFDWLLVAVVALAPALVAELIRSRRRGYWVA